MKPSVKIDRRSSLGNVRDQGPFPTCLAYATSLSNRNFHGVSEPLSAETLHYHATDGGWHKGCTTSEMERALERHGQPKTSDCPPFPGSDIEEWQPPDCVTHFEAKSTTPKTTIDKVSEALKEGNLPVLGIETTVEFYYPEEPYVFSRGQSKANHAVTAVGVGEIDGGPAVLIRNSWGEEWAESGHAWLNNSFIEEHLREVLVINSEVNT